MPWFCSRGEARISAHFHQCASLRKLSVRKYNFTFLYKSITILYCVTCTLLSLNSEEPLCAHALTLPTTRHYFIPQDPRWVRPGTLESEDGKVKQLLTLWLLGRRRGREQGGKASGFPASLTAWREGCCQFRLLPCWKKAEVTRGPPGRQPGTRNSIELPPETGLFGDLFPETVLTLKKIFIAVDRYITFM